AIQGHMPERMHVVTGTGERETFKTNDYLAYYRRAKQRFLAALDHEHETYPWPVEHCALCDFLELCIERRERDDHLVLVANIRRNQIHRLQRDGIATLAALAETKTRPHGMREPTFEAIREQAALQLYEREHGQPKWEFPFEPEPGFGLLPEPDDSDVYLDLEGDPYYEPARGLTTSSASPTARTAIAR